MITVPTAAFAQLPNPSYGWNLGNTMEATCGVGCWSPQPTQALINSVGNAGFNTVRIPCAWDTHANQSTYQIDATYMAQVKQVVDWCYARGLTVIINDHWDGGWLENHLTGTVNSTLNAKMNSYWGQIATTFAGYDSHLLFAAANEPSVGNAAQMSELMTYYQTFVNVVRSKGGNNSSRWLVVQGPSTDIDTTDTLMNSLPSDPTPGRMIVEVHFYSPFQFCLMTSDEWWGNMFYFWGQGYHSTTNTAHNATSGEESYLDAEFQKMQNKFTSRGVPVIIGEFRASLRSGLSEPDKSLNRASSTYWDKYVVTSAHRHGMAPICWDTPGQLFDWTTGAVQDQGQASALTGGLALPPPTNTLIPNGTYTIVGVQSGKALDDPGWSTTNGTQMDIWAVNGGNNQKWTLTNLGNNVVKLINVFSGQALEVNGWSGSDGGVVDQWTSSGQANQQWVVCPFTPGVYNLKNVNSGKVLEVYGASTANGANVDQWTVGEGAHQQWKFQ
ncbi:MAG: cellulase family glycosylhydrolase [Capsulimonas sp.]|uniref:cellulase family glycosylhydrolase n=1 Tax=Capsulimonas sp. TaxID=2494211 RepID=UPI0032649CA6